MARRRVAVQDHALGFAVFWTEVVRWEEGYWEMFAGPGPDVTSADARVVPLGILLGADPLLEMVTGLEIGQGLWRDRAESGWHTWAPTAT